MDRRRTSRRRTRLRPGKLLSQDGVFLCDCTICDRTGAGVRVRAIGIVEIPLELLVFDEQDATKRQARRIWAQADEIGFRYLSLPQAVGPSEHFRIAGPYYAL